MNGRLEGGRERGGEGGGGNNNANGQIEIRDGLKGRWMESEIYPSSCSPSSSSAMPFLVLNLVSRG